MSRTASTSRGATTFWVQRSNKEGERQVSVSAKSEFSVIQGMYHGPGQYLRGVRCDVDSRTRI